MVGRQGRQENGLSMCHLSLQLDSRLIPLKIQPGNIEVSSIANRVSNGEVWVIKGVLNYE